MSLISRSAVIGVLLAFATGQAAAQGFPNKTIRIIVPLAPGGTLDLVARGVGQKLGEITGQTVVVENRPGSSGLVGAQFVARSPADGYTLLAMANTFLMAPNLVAAPGYDVAKDFVGVTQTAYFPQVLAVHPSVPARTVQELIALARAQPGQLTYGTSGDGSTGHLSAELFNRAASVSMTHVPYKGNAVAMGDLLGGRITMMYDSINTVAPYLRTGKLRAIAITTGRRSAMMPELPTIAESGLPGYESATLNGIVAPAGVPADVIVKLYADIVKALTAPDLRGKFGDQGVDLVPSDSPEAFTRYLREETMRYAKLAKDIGIKPN